MITMTERTIHKLIEDITLGAQAQGIDVSPKDVGWIVSTFCETMFTGPEFSSQFNIEMQRIADEAASVKDEG